MDGGDPRDTSLPTFQGYAYPQDQPKPHTGWVAPGRITPITTNNTNVEFGLMLAWPRQNLRDQVLNGIYPLATPDNPFGVLQTFQRRTYADLEKKLGGEPFASVDDDALQLGQTSRTIDGVRWFSVNVTDIEAGSGEVVGGGTPIVYLSATMMVQIPL